MILGSFDVISSSDYFQPYPYCSTQSARVVTLPIIPDFTIIHHFHHPKIDKWAQKWHNLV